MLKAQGPTYDVLPTLHAMGVSGGCRVGLWNISLEVRWESYSPIVGWAQMNSLYQPSKLKMIHQLPG